MSIHDEVKQERARQDAKWGGPGVDDNRSVNDWIAYITRHTGWAVVRRPWDLKLFRRQMIRVAALAWAAVEWCDRRPALQIRLQARADEAEETARRRYDAEEKRQRERPLE